MKETTGTPHTRRVWLSGMALGLMMLVFGGAAARAQNNYEIQV